MYTQDSVVFRIDPRLLQHRPPRLLLAATLETLRRRVEAGELDAALIVDILDENRLLPYIIGDTSKDMHIVSLGQLTNASKIGDIIVSEECIRGTYELCLAFLSLVLTTLRDPDYVDIRKIMLASVTYIANEIYPNHPIWTYKNISDMNRILCCCTEIFHHILVTPKHPPTQANMSDLQIVCVLNLSQNQAHRQLLDVIVEAKQSIKKIISESTFNGEESLKDMPIVVCIRYSLMIFNKLLIYCDFISNRFGDLSTSPTGKSRELGAPNYSSVPTTNIERAIFDTSVRPGLLQHLFSYIYQNDDNRTACLAADLIKGIADKFSMSLMACLGSEAGRACEFFVGCLADKDANIDLEIAILDLLSVCVKHQPGLIELLLDFQQNTKNEKTTSQSSQESSIKVVLNLLKECRNHQDDAHQSLRVYILKFILTFWQKCHSAIEQFDKVEGFWELITHPLVNFLDSDIPIKSLETYLETQVLSDKLKSYALMILAREIFNVNVGINERKMNVKLREKLDEFGKRNFIGKYSTYITKRFANISVNQNKSDDYTCLLSAWRDFIASYLKYKPMDLTDEVKGQLIQDILNCVSTELKLGEKLNRERVASTGDSLLLIWTKWMKKETISKGVCQSMHDLLFLADASKEYLPFSFFLSFQLALNLYLMRNRDYLMSAENSVDLLAPALQMMQFSLKIMEKQIIRQSKKEDLDYVYKPGVESRLCQASMMALRFIVDIAKSHVTIWISYLQTNLKTDWLVQFLTLLISKRAGPEVFLSAVELLTALSSIREAADHLNKCGLINRVNMISGSAYERPHAHLNQLVSNPLLRLGKSMGSPNSTGALDITNLTIDGTGGANNGACNTAANKTATGAAPESEKPDSDWLPIYHHVICLNVSMFSTLGGDYMRSAVEFLTVHCIRICESIELMRTKLRSVSMDEALPMVHLITLVLNEGCMWKRKNQSLLAITEEINKLAYTTAGKVFFDSIIPKKAITYD